MTAQTDSKVQLAPKAAAEPAAKAKVSAKPEKSFSQAEMQAEIDRAVVKALRPKDQALAGLQRQLDQQLEDRELASKYVDDPEKLAEERGKRSARQELMERENAAIARELAGVKREAMAGGLPEEDLADLETVKEVERLMRFWDKHQGALSGKAVEEETPPDQEPVATPGSSGVGAAGSVQLTRDNIDLLHGEGKVSDEKYRAFLQSGTLPT